MARQLSVLYTTYFTKKWCFGHVLTCLHGQRDARRLAHPRVVDGGEGMVMLGASSQLDAAPAAACTP